MRDDVSGLRTDVQQLQEGQKRLERVSEHTILRLDALGDRWGRRNEATVRSTLRGMFASLGYTVERYEAYDTEGKVHFHPASVEIDIIIRDGERGWWKSRAASPVMTCICSYASRASMRRKPIANPRD
ncbi:MAG: DUF3782 domain-containing protein [Anaerolineae bacterium]|nr:MAG: DUF3782 domain-containing protein [Anaerolineae bacterium]